MRGPRTAMKRSPHLPQLGKALAQKGRPNTAINNKNIIEKKKGQVSQKIRCQKMNLVVAACMMASREGSVNLGRWIKRLLQHPQVEVLGA